MIKAVIFDCFGVLTTDGWIAFCDKYFYADSSRREQATAANKRTNAGLISYQDFIHEAASLAQVSLKEAQKIIETNVPNEKLFEYIEHTLKPDYKIGMLSNAASNWLDQLFLPTQVALLDEVLLSYEIARVKPDPMTYDTIASHLGVLPEECIFIDDQPRYVEGAEQAGMKGITFNDTRQVITQIEELIHA